MKTRFLNPALQFAICSGLIVACCLTGCKKEEHVRRAYSNRNDDSTTSIQLTIPRIELSKLKTTEITVYLSVTDQDGNPLKNFNAYNFIIKQVCKGSTDTTLVGNKNFSSMDEKGTNIAVAATMDYSETMGTVDVGRMQDALSEFVRLKNDNDFFEVIKFSDGYDVVQAFTKDTTTLLDVINTYYPDGRTAFYDAVFVGLTDCAAFLKTTSGLLPAVIAFTDGLENNSYTWLYEILDLAQKEQIPIYTIGYGDVDESVMTEMASATGGRYYYTPQSSELQELFTTVSGQLKNIYQVSWSFTDPTCDEVLVIVESTYTCANGTFKAKAVKSFFPL